MNVKIFKAKVHVLDKELVEAVLDTACHWVTVTFKDIIVVIDDAPGLIILSHCFNYCAIFSELRLIRAMDLN